MSAQEADFCATPSDLYEGDQFIFSNSVDTEFLNNLQPVVLNIFFWQVRDPNGDYYDTEFKEDDLLAGVAFLNQTFNRANIFFKYRGYDGFNSPNNVPITIYEDGDGNGVQECVPHPELGFDPNGYSILRRCLIASMFNYASTNGYRNNDDMNVYVVKGTEGFGAAVPSIGSKNSTVKYNSLTSFQFAHEIGHNLNLSHTRSNRSSSDSAKENVTREPLSPNGDVNDDFNALDVTDRLVDTAAHLSFYEWDPTGQDNYPTVEDCIYVGGETDPTGVFYDVSYEDLANCMANAYDCINAEFDDGTIIFTDGQLIRMHERASSTNYSSVRTTTNALYEPYKGVYPDFLTPSTLNNGVRLQPGFDYKFVECGHNYDQPTNYTDSPFYFDTQNVIKQISPIVTNYNSIFHPNHTAIIIKELDISTQTASVNKCYDNWKTPDIWNGGGTLTGGVITTFNGNSFNYNVTLTQKDSTGIVDPDLIPNLDPGLYKLERQFEDGSKQEEIIYKDN